LVLDKAWFSFKGQAPTRLFSKETNKILVANEHSTSILDAADMNSLSWLADMNSCQLFMSAMTTDMNSWSLETCFLCWPARTYAACVNR